jgi:hypothetical protein
LAVEEKKNPLVSYMETMDPATAKLLDEAAALDRALGIPDDIVDVDDLSEWRSWTECAACGARLISASGERETLVLKVEVDAFVPSVRGVSRDLPVVDDGKRPRILSVTEFPTICAKGACLDKVMSDPTWARATPEALSKELNDRREL